MKELLSFWVLFWSTLTFGHGESEVFYTFDFSGHKTLKVDLTASTALSILFSEKPELREKELVSIAKNVDLLESYFNRVIQLRFEEQEVGFNYLKSDFSIHDSYILFTFDLEKMEGSYRLMIDALCDLYRSPTNGVRITEVESTKEFWLNCHQNIVQGKISTRSSLASFIGWIIVLLLGGSLVTLFLRKKHFFQRNH